VNEQDTQHSCVNFFGTHTFGTLRKLIEDLTETSATQNLMEKNELNKWIRLETEKKKKIKQWTTFHNITL